MTTATRAAGFRRPWLRAPTFEGREGLGLVAFALLSAAVVGLAASVAPLYAAALVVGAALALLVAVDITVLPVFLVCTMFLESVELGPGLRIGRIAAVVALAVVAYHLLLERRRLGLRANGLLLATAGYGCWILVSSYWASDPGYVYDTTFRFLLAAAYMVTFAVLIRDERQLVVVFATLAVGALVFGVASFVGYVTSFDTYRISTDPSTLQQSAKGLQGDHNFFAVYQVVALPAALSLAALVRRGWASVFYFVVVGVIVLSVVASFSRSALIALASVVVATILLPARYLFRRGSQKLGYLAAIGFAACVVALTGAAPFLKRALTIFHEQGSSGSRGSGRIDLWRAAWRAYEEHTFLGLGAGNFRARSADLLQTTPGVTTIAGNTKIVGRYVHNMYLENLAELGAVGFGIFVLVLALTGWYLLSALGRARRTGNVILIRTSVALLVTLAGFAASGFFLSLELGKPLWIIVGLALAIDVMSRRAPPVPASAQRRPLA